MNGDKLKALIKSKGIKQVHLAENELGIKYVTFYQKMRGNLKFSVEESIKLKNVLGMSEDMYEEIFG